MITSLSCVAGARAPFAAAAAKLATWTEIAGERGAGRVGEERRTRVVGKKDEMVGFESMSDREVVERLEELLRQERRLTAAVLAHLGEVEGAR